MSAYIAVVDDLSINGADTFPNFYINIVDDGSNAVFTPTAFRNGTPSSSGTSITIPWVVSTGGGAGSAGLTKSRDFKVAFEAAMRAVLNDRSING
jgi:hypothetical protein